MFKHGLNVYLFHLFICLFVSFVYLFICFYKSVKKNPKSKKENEIWTFINVHFSKPKILLGKYVTKNSLLP